MPKKYKKVSDRPEGIGDLIDLCNQLPKNRFVFESGLLKLKQEFSEPNLKAFLKPELIQQIKSIAEKSGTINACFRLAVMGNECRWLRDVVEACQMEAQYNKFAQVPHPQDYNFSKPISAFHFNEDSTLDLRVIGLLFGVPIRRIRECPICEKIYWAKKTNSETCGEKYCIDTLGNKKRLEKAKQKSEAKATERKRILNQDYSTKKEEK